MSDGETQDWETRARSYQNLLDLMQDPTEDVIAQVEQVLPQYLADTNPTCQLLALSICDLYLKSDFDDINYTGIATILIKHCLNVRQQNVDQARNQLLFCLRNDLESITELLFQNILSKPTNVIITVISVVVSHLATLTSRDEKQVRYLRSKLEPLAKQPNLDDSVHKEAADAIAAARIILGSDFETTMSPKKAEKKAEIERWTRLIDSDNWKDRKQGYEELLDNLHEDSDLKLIEKHFLVQAGAEKYTLCEVLVAQIIEKMATIFKTQLSRKLRDYVNPIIALLQSKRQSRVPIFQKALDSLATNVVASPYEAPFVEFLLKMMTSTSAQLREESLNFIIRVGTTGITQAVRDQIKNMASDQLPGIRKLAQSISPEQGHQQPVQKPMSARGRIKRKSTVQSMQAVWTNWVTPETLSLLQNSSQWTEVTKGLDMLKAQFEEDPSQPAAVVGGLALIFTGKTFTPKVMANIMNDLLFFMKYDLDKLSDECLTQAVSFCLDKIQDKKYESLVFEILDTVSTANSSQFVFQLLYPHLTAKNPMIPLRIVQYFEHHLSIYGADAGINVPDFAESIKPLFTHGDSQIRKTVAALATEVKSYDPAYADLFKAAPTPKPAEQKPVHQKSKSEIPSRANKPMSPRHVPEPKKEVVKEDDSYIPQKLVQSIAKTGSIVETRKGLDEIENILAAVQPNSVHATEFLELFVKLRQWFKDSSTNIVLSVTKVITGALKCIIRDEIDSIANEFFCDMCLLLNFAHRGIRTSTVAALTELFGLRNDFMTAIFIPSFFKLNGDGRKTSITFLKNMLPRITMTIEDYGPFIMNILVDKSDDFRESAKPVLAQFFALTGALDAEKDMANQLQPAQKSLVLSRLEAFDTRTSYFKKEPTQEERDQREEMLDPFLPLKVINSEEKAETLTEILATYSEMYFTESIMKTDTESVTKTCEMFLKAIEEEYDSFSMVLDIIFMWWANQALLIKVQECFNEIIEFLTSLLQILNKNERVLEKYEFSIILPTILECLGRDDSLWIETRDLLFSICDDSDLVTVGVQILSMASSVYTIVAAIKILKNLAATNDVSPYAPELMKRAKKIMAIVEDDSDKQELYDVSKDFVLFLQGSEQKSAIPKPKPRRPQKESPKGSAIPKFSRRQQPKMPEEVEIEEEPKMPSEIEIDETPKYAARSVCQLNETITSVMQSPSILLYQWIADLNNPDSHAVISALKAISGYLKNDPMIWHDHVDALMVSLFAKMHGQFRLSPLPIRACKYIAFAMLTLISTPELANSISFDFTTQLIKEVIEDLSVGITEPVVNQVLNAILMKLIENWPLKSFTASLKLSGDFDNEDVSERKVKRAIKCLEASGTRLCELSYPPDMVTAVTVVDQFFDLHPLPSLEASVLGSKVSEALKAFTNQASEQVVPELPQLSPPRIQGKTPSRKIIAPDVPKKTSPIRNFRPRP